LLAQTSPKRSSSSNGTIAKYLGVAFLIAALVLFIRRFDNDQAGQLPGTTDILGTQTIIAPPTDHYQYEVKSGDTLFSISERFSVNWELVVSLNELSEPYFLEPGREIKLPINEITRTQQFFDNLKNKIYVVESGDTFVSIAQKLNISVTELLRSNPQLESPDTLRPGQILSVP